MATGLDRIRQWLVWHRLADLALPPASLDLAYAIHVLEHVRNVHLTLRRLHDALCTGAMFFLHTPAAPSDGAP